MSRAYRCDQCEKVLDEPPITVGVFVDLFDDDDDDDEPACELIEHHFCTLSCLASWAMTEALTNNEANQ